MWLKRTVFLLSFCLVPSLLNAQTSYRITDLGALSPTGINDWGQIVGNYNNRGYLWETGTMRSLGILPGGTFSWAAAINDASVITGTADGEGSIVARAGLTFPTLQCPSLVQPFLWSRGKMTGLGTVGPALGVLSNQPSYSCAAAFFGTAINSQGQVVGYTADFNDDFAWNLVWTAGSGMNVFGSSFHGEHASGINDSGTIAGQDRMAAASWSVQTASENGAPAYLEGTTGFSAANDVNDAGQTVGWSEIPGGSTACPGTYDCFHAALWSQNGAIQDLGTLPGDAASSATKVNSAGVVIGASGTFGSGTDQVPPQENLGIQMPNEATGHPFLWSQRTGMVNLNTLIQSRSGWVLLSAKGINALGQIVGDGLLQGKPHGYLLTPTSLLK